MNDWRSIIRAQTKAQLDAWNTSEALAQAVLPGRPASFPASPTVYVGGVRAQHQAASGVVRSRYEVDVVAVVAVVSNTEAVIDADAIGDSLVAWFAARAHYVQANTVAEPVSSESLDISVGDVAYHGVVVTIGNILIAEGRN